MLPSDVAFQSEECNTHACPNDGVWMDWSPWVDCSVTCGGGLQTRERLCDGPYFGGQDCMGEEMDNRTCNNFYCPGNVCKGCLFVFV